jgi:hypothetical protein
LDINSDAKYNGNNDVCPDVSAIPVGVYIIEAKTEKGVEVKKFIKE